MKIDGSSNNISPINNSPSTSSQSQSPNKTTFNGLSVQKATPPAESPAKSGNPISNFFHKAEEVASNGLNKIASGAKDLARDAGAAAINFAESKVTELSNDLKGLGGLANAVSKGAGIVSKANIPGVSQVAGAVSTGTGKVGDISNTVGNVLNSSGDKKFDGAYVGANGTTSNTVGGVKPVTPNNGTPQTGASIYYVNGIGTDLATQSASLQNIANKTGANVYGIHNATEGHITDIAQSGLDKADRGNNPAVNTLAEATYNAAKNGQTLNIVAHSQGGIITSRAIEHAKERLISDGLSQKQAEDLLAKSVNVQTFGGAAGSYPAGPNYRHVVNDSDPVSGFLGLGNKNPFKGSPGGANNTQVVHFNDDRGGILSINSHSFDDVYLSRLNNPPAPVAK